jgi:hypothetical protein
MVDAPASQPLHNLQAELSGVKSQWQSLLDVIVDGYNDAYDLHLEALEKMHQARLLREQQEARVRGYYMFVLSVISAGFAGGAVGGLIGAALKPAKDEVLSLANTALREGVKSAGSRASTQLVKSLVPQGVSPPPPNNAPYTPVSPKAFSVYIKKLRLLDDCFAIINERIMDLINAANASNWPAEVGWDVLNSFRKNCFLLTDAPRHDQLPALSTVAKASELAMWVAWTNARDWPWWNEVYIWIDDYAEGLTDFDDEDPNFQYAHELDAGLDRMRELGKADLVKITLSVRTDPSTNSYMQVDVLDLRKLRNLRLQDLPDLPLKKMQDLNFAQIDNLIGRQKFLDNLNNLRPSHVK